MIALTKNTQSAIDTISLKLDTAQSPDDNQDVIINVDENTSILGLLNHYNEHFIKLEQGIYYRDTVADKSNPILASEAADLTRKEQKALHDFEAELPTFAYFLNINGQVYYVGFDYNRKVFCDQTQFCELLSKISIDKNDNESKFKTQIGHTNYQKINEPNKLE